MCVWFPQACYPMNLCLLSEDWWVLRSYTHHGTDALNSKSHGGHSVISQQSYFISYQTAETGIHYSYQFRQAEVFNFNGAILKRRVEITGSQRKKAICIAVFSSLKLGY